MSPACKLIAVVYTILFSTWALTPSPARAEMASFDPLMDEVPQILDPEDLALVDAFLDVKDVQLGPIRPDGGALFFARLPLFERSYTAFIFWDLLDVETGQITSFSSSVPWDAVWLDEHRVGWLEDYPSTESMKRVEMDTRIGEQHQVEIEWLRSETYDLVPYGSSPDLSQYLLRQFDEAGSGGRHHGKSSFALVDKDGGNRREIGVLTGTLDHVAWSADASRIALGMRGPAWAEGLSSEAYTDEALGRIAPENNPVREWSIDYVVFDVADGRERLRIDRGDVSEGRIWSGARLSPAGRWLQFTVGMPLHLASRPFPTYQRATLAEHKIIDVDSGMLLDIEMPFDRSIESLPLFEDEEHLLIANLEGLDTRLLRVDIASGRSEIVWDRPGSIQASGLEFKPLGTRLVFLHESFDEPREIWIADRDDIEGTARPITRINEAARRLSRLRSLDVHWTDDQGWPLSGRLVYREDMPPSADAGLPVVVWQRGGLDRPTMDSFGWTTEQPTSLLPNLGLPVFVANVAGRSAGDAALHASLYEHDHFGQIDVHQLRAGVERLVDLGIVDADRVGITGCSYGGYVAWQSLIEAGDLYAAANPQCSLVDLIHYAAVSPLHLRSVSFWMGARPDEAPAEYRRDSPILHVDRVRAPTLVFHGSGEQEFPFGLLREMHDQLDRKGLPVRLLRFNREGHGLYHPASQSVAVQEQARFFRQHLVEGSSQPIPELISTPMPSPTVAPTRVPPSTTPTPEAPQQAIRRFLPWVAVP